MLEGLAGYLKKFEFLGVADKAVRLRVEELLQSECGIAVKSADVTLRRGVISVPLSPAARSALLFKKNSILETLKKEFSKDYSFR